MSNEKKLIEMNNLPRATNIKEVIDEIYRVLRMTSDERRDLAGIIINEAIANLLDEEKKRFYIYFRNNGMIEMLRNACTNEEDSYILYIMNSKVELKFPERDYWTLETSATHNKLPNDDTIRIKNTFHKNILDVLELLPRTCVENENSPIMAVTQNENSTFIKLNSSEEAERLIRWLRRQRERIDAVRSNTYTFVSKVEQVCDNNLRNINERENFRIVTNNEYCHVRNGNVNVINLGPIRNISDLQNNLLTGTWQLMLIKSNPE